jgi:hypothetical protein
MLRRVAALAVAALVMPVLVSAADTPVADHDAGSLVSAPPSQPSLVPTAGVSPVLQLVWLDPAGVAIGTEVVVEPEVAKLLRGMGVRATWRRGKAQEFSQPGELRVIFLNRPAPPAHGASVLGATPSSVQGAPFVWVYVPSVRAAAGVGPRTGPLEGLASTRRVGIALARVIVHELVHAVAPSVPHGRGLMSPRLDSRMLTGASIAADPQLGVAVRSALAGLAPIPALRPVPEILAAESGYKEPYR